MSKEVEWGVIHGEGEIVCTCDHCGYEERLEFEDGPDFREAQDELREMGWSSSKINGEWFDFCSMDCRNAYIKENL